ncbi:hypothetical protein C8J57DRAFT_1259333 [Mycena rebaudengoi]|nr:hypothetical protein C8J57DRAFT_1259333 [Mycena rebaudengoi]
MANQVFMIEELCDHITNDISLEDSSQADLKSTALVCRTLRYCAQSYLFRHVRLDRDPHTQAATAAASRRLSTILTESPHLLGAIRQLTILAIPQILEPLISRNIWFPLLQGARLNFWETLMPPDEMHYAFWRASSEISLLQGVPFERFTSLFDNCSPNLCTLALRGVYIHAQASTRTLPIPILDVPPLLVAARRIRITRLALGINSSDVEKWLVSPQCPFDFTHLVDLDMPLRPTSPIPSLMFAARSSITRLRLSFGRRRLPELRLSEFPALTCLETNRFTCDVISTLPPNNSVQRFVLDLEAVAIPNAKGVHTDLWFGSTDTLIANSQTLMPLQVALRVNNAAPDFDLDSVRECFPLLREKYKELLVVMFMIYDAMEELGLIEYLDLGFIMEDVLEQEREAALGNGRLGRCATSQARSLLSWGTADATSTASFSSPRATRGNQLEVGMFYLHSRTPLTDPRSLLRHPTHGRTTRARGSPRCWVTYEVARADRLNDGTPRAMWSGGQEVLAAAHDVMIPGYTKATNTLRL